MLYEIHIHYLIDFLWIFEKVNPMHTLFVLETISENWKDQI